MPATDDFNTRQQRRRGLLRGQPAPRLRWNATKAFLRPALARGQPEVWTGVAGRRLLFDAVPGSALQATGVEVLPQGGGALQAVHAAREVMLCAGAVGTPQILQLSGIGPAACCSDAGIAVRHDLPGVGENLQDHLQIRAVFAGRGRARR
jgi:choline dehydrogenase